MKTTSSFLGRPARQTGFTLIEALVVMIVGIIILAGAAAGIGKLFTQSGITSEAENITQMYAGVRGLRTATGYDNLSNKLVVQFKAVPASMTFNASTFVITNTWGGAVYFGPYNSNQGYLIEYQGLPEEACQQMAQKMIKMGWESIRVFNDGSGSNFSTADPVNPVVKTSLVGTVITKESVLSDIQTACAPKAAGDKINIDFVSAN